MSQFLSGLRERRNLVLALISLWLIPLLINLLSTWLVQTLGATPTRLLQLVAIIVAILAALWIVWFVLSRRPALELVPEEQRPPRYPGLVVLVSKPHADATPDELSHTPAIEYHLDHQEAGGESLKVCWLIATTGPAGSVAAAMEAKKRYKERCLIVIQTLDSAFDVQEAYHLVRRIYQERPGAEGIEIKPEQIIADFTGGTSPMSAGMVLACAGRWPMQYMYGRRGVDIPMPIQVHVEPAAP